MGTQNNITVNAGEHIGIEPGSFVYCLLGHYLANWVYSGLAWGLVRSNDHSRAICSCVNTIELGNEQHLTLGSAGGGIFDVKVPNPWRCNAAVKVRTFAPQENLPGSSTKNY